MMITADFLLAARRMKLRWLRLRWPVAMVVLAACSAAVAQDGTAKAIGDAWKALAEGRYLAASDILRPLAMDTHRNVLDEPAFQMWNQIQSTISGEPVRRANAPQRRADRATIALLAQATPRYAIDEIVKRARSTRVVILNEDHVHPRQRAFALAVARALRPLGYDVIAAEALNNTPDARQRMRAIRDRGYVELDDGVYTRDPVFADFLRQSIRLGYRLVSYENTRSRQATQPSPDIGVREQVQAENLAAALAEAPRSKFLVYVGASHVAERPIPGGSRGEIWMAERLASLAAIDPLTIDQTTPLPENAPRRLKRDDRLFTLFAGHHPLVIGQYRKSVDLQVFAPQRPLLRGRPSWLTSMGRSVAPIPRDLLPLHGRRLVQAFIASESKRAIPIDQVIVDAGASPPPLMLPQETVRYQTQDSSP